LTDVSAEQSRILAEVAHDLANRFHRFYYFAEILSRLLPAERGEAHDYLERAFQTVEDIEGMTRGALSYLRPMDVRTVRVQVRDLLGSLRQHLGERALQLETENDTAALPVAVDPTRMGEALGNVCRAVLTAADEKAALEVQVRKAAGVALTFSCDGTLAEPLSFDLPLALAAKILRLHGGDLDVGTGQRATLTVHLPVAAEE
jgi:signal transduction histidine kinase